MKDKEEDGLSLEDEEHNTHRIKYSIQEVQKATQKKKMKHHRSCKGLLSPFLMSKTNHLVTVPTIAMCQKIHLIKT